MWDLSLLEMIHKIRDSKLRESSSSVRVKSDCGHLFKKRSITKFRSSLSSSAQRPQEASITFGHKGTKHLDRQAALLKAKPSVRTAGSEYVTLPKSHVLRGGGGGGAVEHETRTNATLTDANRTSLKQGFVTRIRNEQRTGDGSSSSSNCGMFNKPTRGWLHPDNQIVDQGVSYEVRYVGRLEVNTSMKILDFETRSHVAKECINRICEAAGLKTVDRKRKVDKKVMRMLGDRPGMEHAGADVQLIVTSACLELRSMESNDVIAVHDMPNISFASGGDADTLDFVAYVAKDSTGSRSCYVLECGSKWAQDVITTIGQAFELRFKEYLRNNSKPSDIPQSSRVENTNFKSSSSNSVPPRLRSGDDPVYYNDLPGKIPPENGTAASSSSTINKNQAPGTSSKAEVPSSFNNQCHQSTSKDLSPNLIDLNSEPASPDPFGRKQCPEYANDAVCNVSTLPLGGATLLDAYSPRELSFLRDPFDMQPFEASLPPTSSLNGISPLRPRSVLPVSVQNLYKEEWFHGPISRRDAESLLQKDGEFLVRESLGSPGQYVLTGLQGGTKKHLLLVDPEGVVRTKDKTFESVSHLVNYHRNNGLPIISAESALILRHPVSKRS